MAQNERLVIRNVPRHSDLTLRSEKTIIFLTDKRTNQNKKGFTFSFGSSCGKVITRHMLAIASFCTFAILPPDLLFLSAGGCCAPYRKQAKFHRTFNNGVALPLFARWLRHKKRRHCVRHGIL